MTWALVVLQNAFTHGRTVVTPYSFATTFVPALFSFYFMAVLVQLQATRLYRLSLLPVVFWTSFRAGTSLDFSWNHPGYAYLNQGLALAMFTVSMRSTAWAFARKPYVRLPIYKPENGSTNGHGHAKHGVSICSAMWNACDLVVNLRGIGWNGPPYMRIRAPDVPVESRPTFCALSLCRLIVLVLVFDALDGYVRSLGPDTFGTPQGGSIFDPSLVPPLRYMKSSFVCLLCGITAYVVIDLVYQLHAVLFTILFGHSPSQWPPLFDAPWVSTSLSSLWSQRWHQLFREPFVAVGGRPMGRLLGQTGTVIGAFALSGILHDVGVRGMDRGTDTLRVVGFFLMQGVGVILEHTWKHITGKRVCGFVGWLWTYAWLFLWGHLLVDVWGKKGLLGSEFFPEAYRPTVMLMNWISQ